MRNERRLVVSTCGTSLLTNVTGERGECGVLTRRANDRVEAELGADRDLIASLAERAKTALAEASLDDARRASAELNGVVGLYEGRLESAREDLHFLLHTDTLLGARAAELLLGWLERQGLRGQLLPFRDLRASRVDELRAAFPAVVRWCEETLEGYRRQGYAIVFNLCGGFKAVQGFMQALGSFYADECVYLFESGRELLRIPRLPITIDGERVIGEHLEAFRRLGLGEELAAERCAGIPETLLFRVDDKVSLSEWGELVWARGREQVMSKRLLEELSDKLRYSERMRESCKKLPPDRMVLLNQRLDELALYLETRESSRNPRKLDFKKLKGSPRPPSSHECDAWSDRDARRILGHFEGQEGREVFVVDELSPHL